MELACLQEHIVDRVVRFEYPGHEAWHRLGLAYTGTGSNPALTVDDAPVRRVLELARTWEASVTWDMASWGDNPYAEVQNGTLAFSEQVPRRIYMQPVAAYGNADRAARVLSHELIHTTGPALGRERSADRDSVAMAVEEMVAEAGAWLLSGALHFPVHTQAMTGYIARYLHGCPDGMREPLTRLAVEHARIAVDVLLGEQPAFAGALAGVEASEQFDRALTAYEARMEG